MTVYVDELKTWTNRRPFHRGSCHMEADSDQELHAMARKLGLKREWHQVSTMGISHYDLVPSKRSAAVRLGAREVKARDRARARIRQRELKPNDPRLPGGPLDLGKVDGTCPECDWEDGPCYVHGEYCPGCGQRSRETCLCCGSCKAAIWGQP